MRPAPRCRLADRRALLGIVPAALLAACQPAAPVFKAIDITGATFSGQFSLPDTEGRVRTIADFKGQAVLLFFGFTQCPDVCPTALGRAVEARKLLGAEGPKVAVLLISVDPERDTPEVLREYTKLFDPSFVALRGDAAQLAETAQAFRVFYEKVPTGSSYTMSHSTLSYVFDPQGRLRLAVRHEQSAADLAADLRNLLQA